MSGHASPAASAAHGVATLVLELANTRNVSRVELLALACSLLGADRTAALLWLWEDRWRLLVLSRYASNVVDDKAPTQLIDLVAKPSVDANECPNDPRDWQLGIDHQQPLEKWARAHGFDKFEAILPVTVGERVGGQSSLRTVAFIQLLSSSEIDANARRNVEIVCGGMALLLTRSRDARRLDAIQELLRAEQRGRQIKEWLELAADKLISITNAEAAMMFREAPDGYEAVVTRGKSTPKVPPLASKTSVVTHVALRRDPVRLLDFASDAERMEAFGTVEHDLVLHEVMEGTLLHGPIRSVLLAPVVFEKHTLAVIALVNKKADVHLARIFSKTDEEVLGNVCGFLKGVLPSVELYAALGEMANVVSPKSLESPEEARRVYDVVVKMIPAVAGIALIRNQRGAEGYTIDMFGGSLWTDDADMLARANDAFRPARGAAKGNYYRSLKIPETEHYLTVELKRKTTTGYENQILLFFAKALSHILLAEKGREDVIETFAQLRHAVRSGITGVVGYVNECLGCFEIYRQMKYAPSFLSQARFRKALERANFAAKKSSHLLEESRFLLTNITRESLKLVNQSVSVVVVAVLNTLKPYAEERRIDVSFNNELLKISDFAEIDRSLVEMLIFNVVDNAIKYSFRNRALHVTLDGTREEWSLTVVDYGTQILERDMEAIFLPFTRRPTGHAAEQRPGTGLGLAVARQIARAHGGDVTCSSIGVGHDAAETTFVITIPKTLRKGLN